MVWWEFVILNDNFRVQAWLHRVLEEVFHPNVALDVFLVSEGTNEFLPGEVHFVVKIVEVVDSVVEIGCSLGAVEDVYIEGVWDFEDRERVECGCALVELPE